MTLPAGLAVDTGPASQGLTPRRPVARELLPCPLPYPDLPGPGAAAGCCHAVRTRLHRRVGWQKWANDGVQALNEIYGGQHARPPRASAGQLNSLVALCSQYRDVGPPTDVTPAAAFTELCGSHPGYADENPVVTPFKRDRISLPPVGIKFADAGSLLTGEDLEAWRSWRRELLCSPAELAEAQQQSGDIVPHTDPLLRKRPQRYAEFIKDLWDRGLVSIGDYREPTVGVFFVRKGEAQQRLIVDTRVANQQFSTASSFVAAYGSRVVCLGDWSL